MSAKKRIEKAISQLQANSIEQPSSLENEFRQMAIIKAARKIKGSQERIQFLLDNLK